MLNKARIKARHEAAWASKCNHSDTGLCAECKMEAHYSKQLVDLKLRLLKHIDKATSADYQQVMICCNQISSICAKQIHMLMMKEMI